MSVLASPALSVAMLTRRCVGRGTPAGHALTYARTSSALTSPVVAAPVAAGLAPMRVRLNAPAYAHIFAPTSVPKPQRRATPGSVAQ